MSALSKQLREEYTFSAEDDAGMDLVDPDVIALCDEVERLEDESRWIPVAERLPDQGRYLVYDGERKLVRVGEFRGDGYDYFLCGFDVVYPTHWKVVAGPEEGS